MKIISNEKIISRNKKIGAVTTIGSLIVLIGGFVLSITDKTGERFGLAFAALFVGFILSQVGIYFGNRWGKSPRPDEQINIALKGIGDRYSIYHYVSPVSHLLVGPSGLYTLIPMQQGGTITYDENKNKFRQKGGNLYLKIFAQESLGRPDVEAKATMKDMQDYLAKNNIGDLPITPILIFTNPKATVEVENSPYPALALEKIKDYFKKQLKSNSASTIEMNKLIALLPAEEKTKKAVVEK